MKSWNEFLKEELQKDYYKKLTEFVLEDSKKYTVYPSHSDIFNAFKFCPLDKVKTVILGQDPYHGVNQAHGLSFSVLPECDIPPSLRNIYKEINSDLGTEHKFKNGYLLSWAQQGVLLLNTSLTVRAGQANSHQGKGWEILTDAAITILNKSEEPIIFILWGANARSKKKIINNPQHLILESAHPSPLSAHNGFFGSKPFSKTNEFLIKNGKNPINWLI